VRGRDKTLTGRHRMNVFEYAWRADATRRSRLHDLQDHPLPFGQFVEIPLALASVAARWAFGYRPVVPWVPRLARRAIQRVLHPESRVLEFGSGMSTLWLASRCAFVHSIEHDPRWHAVMTERLAAAGVTDRVRYELRDLPSYANLADVGEATFDLCVIDGAERAACATNAVNAVRPGGYVYWDNSDNTDPDAVQTGAILHDALARRGGTEQRFLGLPPTTGHVTQGALFRLD
jgi:Methyltransferase domain